MTQNGLMKERDEGEDKLLMDYLLGKLSPEEEIHIEKQYVEDAGLQEKLVEIEDELMDRYLEGQLSQEERRQFEGRFLSSPRGCQKLELARSLITVASQVSETRALPKASERTVLGFWGLLIRFPLRFTVAALALVVLLTLVWSIRDRVEHGNMRIVKPQHSPASSPTSKPSGAPQVTAIAEVVLQPVSRELVRIREVSIHSNTEQLRIQLEIGGNRKMYTARVLNTRGQIKWAGRGLRVQSTNSGRTLTLLLPTTLFENGEHTILLSSDYEPTTTIAEYSFVVRK